MAKQTIGSHTHIAKERKQTTRPASDELVDMELHCLVCNARLYLPLEQADRVIAAIAKQGIAILICVCGQAQVVREKPHLHA